uniref:Uncharacterized protein n=1 Tax=Arundo donax TaxID=35708 RepID=A0A0A8YZ85_ARUDO
MAARQDGTRRDQSWESPARRTASPHPRRPRSPVQQPSWRRGPRIWSRTRRPRRAPRGRR